MTTLSAQERSTADISAGQKGAPQATAANALGAAQQQTGGAVVRNDSKFGAGLRIGGYNAVGMGVSARSWFQSRFGVQAGVSRYGYGDFFGFTYSSTQFTPAVLYQFALTNPIRWAPPLTLRPYVGAGLSIIRSSFAYPNNVGQTDTGVLILGGAEIFFNRAPQLGLSAEFEFVPSERPYAIVHGVGGPGFSALAHWYFN
jgi:hypothetical protein